MTLQEDIETYLWGRPGNEHKKRIRRVVSPAMKAYRNRGKKGDEE
jgi:hypothetical protein